MATIGLSYVGGVLGGMVAGPFGAALGQAIGGSIGAQIDTALLTPTQRAVGPRLESLTIQSTDEGAALPCIDGRAKVAGALIWATRLEEVVSKKKSGGKGAPKSESTTYSYFANFAVALADTAAGEIRHISRVWADGKPLDLRRVQMRFYDGSADQMPDPLIVAKDGEAPAYRGTSYVVFERLPVSDYGNRIPSMSFEVWGQSGTVEDLVRGVDLAPGATEWGYSPHAIRAGGNKSTEYKNASRIGFNTDWSASLDMMQGILPGAQSVALGVSWFGTDLRAGHCKISPHVEARSGNASRVWSSGGVTQATARLVSQTASGPAFGSSPDDWSVIEAIKDLRARGLRVILCPSLLMDIPAGNALPDPSGKGTQGAYPWRGRVSAEVGVPVADQVAAFMGASNEWNYRRFILHYASLARDAGGVDAFLIGSQMRGLTQSTDTPGVYPFVDALAGLASEVKSILPTAKVSYGADWSEYHSHRKGAEVFFNLDPLWSSPAVDFVGIDNYFPLSDWRNGVDHLDYDAALGRTAVYDLDYLKANIEGGEHWDYTYATDAARAAQVRTPIRDAAHGEDWVFRQKAVRDWHGKRHHNRPAGVRAAGASGWVPGSKPVWFTALGCAAVDLGSNQPNVCPDAKSSEPPLPYFSAGQRDDFMQRQYLRASLEWWRDHPGVVDFGNIHVGAWDARPWPEFPAQSERWSDASSWRLGHWLNGRLGGAPAAEVLARRLRAFHDVPAHAFDVSRAYGQQDGFFVSDPTDFRSILSPWEVAGRIDAAEIGGVLTFSNRDVAPLVLGLTPEDLVDAGEALYTLTRAAAEEIPRSAVVKFADQDRDYATAAARAVIETGTGEAETSAELAFVSDLERMTMTAQVLLRAKAEARESLTLTLPPSMALRPGQVFTLTPRGGKPRAFIAEEIVRGSALEVTASLYPRAAFRAGRAPVRPARRTVAPPSDRILPVLLDLPIMPAQTSEDFVGWAAFHARPWPGGADLYRSPEEETGYSINLRSGVPAIIGQTVAPLDPGTPGRWSGEVLAVEIWSGGLVPRPEIDVLNGENALAVEHPSGAWEVVQFARADLQPSGVWHLSRLLRGQLGTEHVRAEGALPSGARIVLLDETISPVAMTAGDIGRSFWFKAGPVGHDPAEADAIRHTFGGVGRRPYAPCHLRGSLVGGVLSLRWIRRTRIEGDIWADGAEVPLGEASESYRVEIGPTSAPLRSVLVSSPSASLDVSGISGGQEVRVSQVSASYGPGPAARLSMAF